MARATTLACRFMAIAESKGGQRGLVEAVEEMERAVAEEIPGTGAYAVKLFLAHFPQAGQILQAETDEPAADDRKVEQP